MHSPRNGTRNSGIPAAGPPFEDGRPRASGSSLEQLNPPGATGLSSTQATNEDNQPKHTPRSSPSPQSELYQNILVECNRLIEEYRKGKISKLTVYIDIHSKLTEVLGDDRARCDTAFGSFVPTVESHNSESASPCCRYLANSAGILPQA
jgi:hypothetical protein